MDTFAGLEYFCNAIVAPFLRSALFVTGELKGKLTRTICYSELVNKQSVDLLLSGALILDIVGSR